MYCLFWNDSEYTCKALVYGGVAPYGPWFEVTCWVLTKPLIFLLYPPKGPNILLT